MPNPRFALAAATIRFEFPLLEQDAVADRERHDTAVVVDRECRIVRQTPHVHPQLAQCEQRAVLVPAPQIAQVDTVEAAHVRLYDVALADQQRDEP